MQLCRMPLIIISSIALLAGGAAHGGPAPSAGEGVAKLTDNADGQFFYADANGDLTFVGADDGKFRIQGGALTGVLYVQGDLSGNTQTQLGLADEQKFYFESGNFGWTPAGDLGDINFFFAPNVGLVQVDTGDFDLAGRDCVMKVGTDQFIYVDANCNNEWNGEVIDAKFRIQGGAEAGIFFVKDDLIGLMTDTKWYIDDGDFSWTPGSNPNDTNGFFAPNVGTTVGVVIADFNGDGAEDFAKIAADGFIYADLDGDMAFTGADGKFKIEGGALTGPYVGGSFSGQDGAVGQFDDQKIYVDGNAANAPDSAWTPGAGTETSSFFAPNTGGIQGGGAGSYGAPN